ncbi:MAG TPA: hypothetical protein VFI31_18675 [Pirellulales bacterium]|nr:hypothetical protein [Pirellulales bacterium]
MSSSATSAAVDGATVASANQRVIRATSPAKSRVTIRLPDLSGSRLISTDQPAAPAPLERESRQQHPEPSFGRQASAYETAQPTEPAGTATPRQSASLGEWGAKIVAFVRQPKFWLACIVAAAVQVVLAFAMTPVEKDADHETRLQPPPKWQSKPSEPPAHIVVPAAPVTGAEEPQQAPLGATTPMGPSAPVEPTSENESPAGDALSAERPEERFSATRMVEKRGLVDDSRRFDGRPAAPDGATLGGIAPVEPAPPQ